MRDGFDRVSAGGARAEAEACSRGDGADDLSTMDQVIWCPNAGQPVRIPVEQCERRRAHGDPECANPANQLDGYHFCLGGNWQKRVFWVEPAKDGDTLRIRFEEER